MRLISCLISVVSVVGMSSLFFIGGDRADPMPSKNERQGWSANIFFAHCKDTNGQLESTESSCTLVGRLHIIDFLAIPRRRKDTIGTISARYTFQLAAFSNKFSELR
jgi:hypothetical protein